MRCQTKQKKNFVQPSKDSILSGFAREFPQRKEEILEMKISDILQEEFVSTKLPGKSKDEVLNSLIDLLKSSKKIKDLEKVREAIFEREKIMSTGVGKGFAIPHGKTDAVTDIVAAFAVTGDPVDFQSLDGEPVRLLFLLIGRDNMVGPHIKLLSRISRLMNKDEFRKKLIAAKSSAEIVQFFKEEETSYFDI